MIPSLSSSATIPTGFEAGQSKKQVKEVEPKQVPLEDDFESLVDQVDTPKQVESTTIKTFHHHRHTTNGQHFYSKLNQMFLVWISMSLFYTENSF